MCCVCALVANSSYLRVLECTVIFSATTGGRFQEERSCRKKVHRPFRQWAQKGLWSVEEFCCVTRGTWNARGRKTQNYPAEYTVYLRLHRMFFCFFMLKRLMLLVVAKLLLSRSSWTASERWARTFFWGFFYSVWASEKAWTHVWWLFK